MRTSYKDPAAGVVFFEVQDSGVGIDDSAIDAIFDSFAQADGSTTRKFGGTGLGLSISKQLVEGLGGEITVTSEPGKGSIFGFTIPFRACDEAAEPKVFDRLVGANVVLLEGNDTARKIQNDCLVALGAKVSAYGSAVKGLQHLLTKPVDGIDAILVSSNLSDMTGAQFVDTLAKNTHLDAVKVISLVYMSSQSQDLLANNNQRVGAHLTKPVRLDSLHTILGDVIRGEVAGSKEAANVAADTATDVGGKVLVVEDNEINQLVAMGMLESLGYDVDTADNGLLALTALEDSLYDVILMDCQMPEMDGYEATGKIRAHENAEVANIPIIALTANAMSGDAEKCLNAGMDDYLSKPFEPDLFEEKMIHWSTNGRTAEGGDGNARKAA